MPVRWLTESEQKRLTHFPDTVSEADLATFFTLTENDRQLLTKLHNNANRPGFALQLCATALSRFRAGESADLLNKQLL